MRTFRKLRGVDRPYTIQGEIYFRCLNYNGQSRPIKRKIDRLLAECGGSNEAALREVITGGMTVTEAALKYYLSESSIYNMRKKFYERW